MAQNPRDVALIMEQALRADQLYRSGMTVTEVAEELGIPRRTVVRRLATARRLAPLTLKYAKEVTDES